MTSKTIILLPCPFCGSSAEESPHWREHYGCMNSSCGAYRANLTRHSWNARAPSSERITDETTGRVAVEEDIMPWGWTPPSICRAARFRYADPPQDCDAPFCGCIPEWNVAIEMLQECGWKSPEELRRAEETSDELNCTTCGQPLDDHGGMGLPCPLSKPPEKASGEYQTYPGEPITGIYEAGVAIVRLGKDDEATGE